MLTVLRHPWRTARLLWEMGISGDRVMNMVSGSYATELMEDLSDWQRNGTGEVALRLADTAHRARLEVRDNLEHIERGSSTRTTVEVQAYEASLTRLEAVMRSSAIAPGEQLKDETRMAALSFLEARGRLAQLLTRRGRRL